MDENCLAYGIEISASDWENTPASVKKLVEKMGQQIKQSEKRLADLEAIPVNEIDNQEQVYKLKSPVETAFILEKTEIK